MVNGALPYALLLSVLSAGLLVSAEAVLSMPDPLISGLELSATIEVKDPPARVARIVPPEVHGVSFGQVRAGGSQVQIVNGKMSSTQTIFLPLRTMLSSGRIEIPPIAVHLADGSVLSTATAAASIETVRSELTGDAYAEAFFEPPEAVPGQVVTLHYRMYFGPEVQNYTRVGIAPPPEAISLGDPESTKGQTWNAAGERWTVITQRWPLTFPNPGSATVSGQQDYQIVVGRGFRQQLQSGQVAVRPAGIRILPLPLEGRPPEFSGVIGTLRVEASLDRDRLPLGEGAVLEVRVHGRQLDLLRAPTFAPPPGLQAWPAEKGSAGKPANPGEPRSFRWNLVPESTGSFAIPVFAFASYDPAAQLYVSVTTPPLTLHVMPGRAGTLTISGRSALLPSATAPVASTATPQLPLPLRGTATPRLHPLLLLALGAGGLVVGALAGLVLCFGFARTPRVHRGQRVAQAVRSGDAAQLAAALAHLARDLSRDGAQLSQAQRTALEKIESALAAHRFAGQDVSGKPLVLDHLAAEVALVSEVA